MKLSVFTPTHLPDYIFLRSMHRRCADNGMTNWEWVLVPNGNSGAVIPELHTGSDDRVRIVDGGQHLYNIGAIKRLACDNCSGDVFIELDHDDLLFPGNSLCAIKTAFQSGAGFVFSDPAVFTYGDEKKARLREIRVCDISRLAALWC